MQRECRESPSLPTIKLLPVLGREDSFIRGANNVDIISCGIDVRSVTIFMDTTVNIHMNTGSISESHNWRDKDMILAENSHNSGNYIDISNEFDDSFHITLYRSTLIFGCIFVVKIVWGNHLHSLFFRTFISLKYFPK